MDLTRKDRSSFTLIELLVVIAIISLLFVVAMPVFETFGKKDINGASTELATTLRLARQHAVTQRQWVFVAFPSISDGTYSSENLNKCLQGYVVMALTNETKTVTNFVYLSSWKYLPSGVYILTNSSLTGQVFGTSFPLPFPAESDARRDMAAILFKPNGHGYKYGGASWGDVPVSVFLTTSKFYEPNAAGNNLEERLSVPGITNRIRVRGKTGQVEIDIGNMNF
ncbi:MAG: hypothetical protein A2X46_11950 [Lentisphaerae bacterium GWF2_57_35]|nr:MAG: hypothetical protein A2X46_11950 [Lentisphaerae bacterium GWF2_57_35]